MLKEDYKSLSVAERILLVEDIWDSIATDTSMKLSAAQKKLLDEREEDALAGKISKKSWGEIKEAITSRKNQ
jgi:putative addiction module component (TIGR02574 family)